jgi:hypothetical protein
MSRDGWMRVASSAAGLGLVGWTALAGGAPRERPRDPRVFDLAVEEVDVRQLSSTTMFREVEVLCVVVNRGPRGSAGPAFVVISRQGGDKPKILKKAIIAEPLAPGDRLEVRGENAAWFATPVSYRCEIQFGSQSAGDADPYDDVGETTYPKM